MIRWWLVIGLLLSVGLNVGILATIAARWPGPPPPREGRPPQEGQNPANPNANPNIDPVPRLGRLADRLKLEGDQRRKFLDLQWLVYRAWVTPAVSIYAVGLHTVEFRMYACVEQPCSKNTFTKKVQQTGLQWNNVY